MVGDGVGWREAVAADTELAPLVRDGYQLSPMQFSWEELGAMCGYGSLFLRHVKLQGRPIAPTVNEPPAGLLAALPRSGAGSASGSFLNPGQLPGPRPPIDTP